MGSSSSKFKKYLHHGDEFAAMQVFQSSPELQKNLNPNVSYGEHYNHETALHFAAKHGMKHLLRTFLNDLGGNPNKKNGNNETSLHSACQLTNNKSFSAMERRAACVTFILQWRGPTMEEGGREKIDLTAQDQNGNTALHVASASGLEQCVQTLICAGSSLFVENNDKMTPCDMAVKYGHHNIAQLLESKMVFSDLHNEDELSQSMSESDEVYCGLRTQDLQEAKDQLLVETSDMLQVPLFTAEALLRDNEWSREMLLEKWMKDSVTCCQLAGVEPPQSAFSQGEVTLNAVPLTTLPEPEDNICDICMLSMKEIDQPLVKISCNHNFCFRCWETYLSNKIIEGMQHNILCPAFDCHILVPIDVIERLVSPDLARRYLHFDIKAFVESNKCIKWCPVAGCGRAVRLPENEQAQPLEELKNLPNNNAPPLTSHAVDCGNGHFFCWECLGEAHAPSGCTQWRLWQDKVNQVRPEQLNNDMKELEDASNCLWLVSNSKPCPNCKSPIQKNEGCNHIKCSKCKFDFCWVCLEAWKKHSSATGGYFRCNRFPAALKADEKQGMLISEAVARSQQIQELNRFLHYYTRFKNHDHSRKLEESLLTAAKHKMEVLASSLINGKEVLSDKEKNCTKFIEDGVRELLKARRVLCGSYVHGFYLEDHGYNKTIFEFMQVLTKEENELEVVTEKLSEMIARPYLKTPRHTIMQTTSLSRRKRHEFVRAVSKGLIPPETPPFRKKKRRFPGLFVMDPNNEDEMSHVIMASLKTLDANNPWVKDEQGRHNNLSAIYEWPDFDSDEETEVSRTLAVSLVGECSREGCNRPKARNPRTQTLHEYCSLRCAKNEIQMNYATYDDSMDLIIALEISRLQMIEDTIKRRNYKPNTSVSVTQTETDSDLSRAIELSIKQQTTDVGVTTESTFNETSSENNTFDYRTKQEDVTINHLKSVAVQNFENLGESTANSALSNIEITRGRKELTIFRPHRTEDGRFEISDIHETCFHDEDKDDRCLRRVRSTGDLSLKGAKKDQFKEESRYHLDSDHSSQHDDKPEEISYRTGNFPPSLTTAKSEQQYFLLQEPPNILEEIAANRKSADELLPVESMKADLEVCDILSSAKNETGRVGDNICLFQITSKFDNSLDKIMERHKKVQSVHTTAITDHLSLPDTLDEKTSSNENPSSRKGIEKGNCTRISSFDVDKKSESVKNLIEEVKNTLKSIETDSSSSSLNKSKTILSPDHSICRRSLFSAGSEFLRLCPERASTGKIKSNNYLFQNCSKSNAKSSSTLENLKEAEKHFISKERSDSKEVFFLGSEKNLNEAHKKAFKAAGGKIICKKDVKVSPNTSKECKSKSNSNLKIRISKSPVVTDSSNEYETDTGIPKSPTLFISGVSISRTPEPSCLVPSKDKSPEHTPLKSSPVLKHLHNSENKNSSFPILNLTPPSLNGNGNKDLGFVPIEKNLLSSHKPSDTFLNVGRQSRSSSLTVPRSEVRCHIDNRSLNSSCGAILPSYSDKNETNKEDVSHNLPKTAPRTITDKNFKNYASRNKECVFDFSDLDHGESQTGQERFKKIIDLFNSANEKLAQSEYADLKEIYLKGSDGESLLDGAKDSGKSKSAAEPEREREMFKFPKSSTDGALSSVLHVQESNLSSDDFHEVLFLLERSPKLGSKRKKKSKKERDKVKENSNKDECVEVSSAL